MEESKPDGIQMLWIFRGAFYAIGGLCALGVYLFAVHQLFYLFGGLLAIGYGGWDIWLALSSMSADEAQRITSPARLESATEGLKGTGWDSSNGPKE